MTRPAKKITRELSARKFPEVPSASPAPQPINMSAQQIQQAAVAGVELLGLKTTLLPGDLRRQLAVLEVVLQGVIGGHLVVVSPRQLAVESEPNDDGKS